MNVEANLATIEHLDGLIKRLEKHILAKAKDKYQKSSPSGRGPDFYESQLRSLYRRAAS